MLKATNGKWGKTLDRKIKNVPIASLNRWEIKLDKSFKWKREFDVKSTHNLPNYRQRNDFYAEGFPTFYVYTHAEISFKRKGENKPTVYIRTKYNGKKKVTEIFNGPIFGWESVTNA